MLALLTAIKTAVPLFAATILLLTYTSPEVAQFDQDGAGVGRLAIGAVVVALTMWATNPYPRAGLRRPGCFIIAFPLALLAGGAIIVGSTPFTEGIAAGITLLGTAYTILAAETGYIVYRRWRRRSRYAGNAVPRKAYPTRR